MYKCIKGFSLEKCDGNGFVIEENYMAIEEGSFWYLPEEENYRLIGGEIRLESNECGWIEIDKDTLEEHFEVVKKLFRCNDDGVAEWCVAVDKKQAYEFMKELWGQGTMKECEDEYFKYNPDDTLENFINYFAIEEDTEREFTIVDAGENGEEVTKKVSDWIEATEEVPSYLCFGN